MSDGALRDRIIAGSLWLLGLRWALRALTLVRTVILARLLQPADFGLVNMAVLVLTLVEVASGIGVDLALVRAPRAGRADFDTAWTLRALQRIFVALAVLLLAPLAGRLLAAPEAVPLMRAVALGSFFWAFENIGTVSFRRDLDFRREASALAINHAITIAATIAAALWLQNAWALVVGFLAERATLTAVSYVAHPFRPRPSLAAARELWSFSQWIPAQSVGRFLRDRLDGFLVARFCGPVPMGFYSVGGSVANIAPELLQPLGNPLLAGYARRAADPQRLAAAFTDALAVVAALYVPVSVGMATIAPTLVAVVLGERWLPSVPIVQALVLHHLIQGLAFMSEDVLRALGRMRRLTLATYVQLAVVAPPLLLAATTRDPTTVAVTRTAVAAVIAPFVLYVLIAASEVRGAQVARALWRPMAATAVMVLVLWSIGVEEVGSPASLLVLAVAGVVTYSTATALFWVAAGRPSGPERTAIDWVRTRRR